MSEKSRQLWRAKEMRALFETIRDLESTAEVEAYLRDLCTVAELEAMAHRWQVAGLVDRGLPYLEVAARTGASTTTVTRVARALRYGEDGYRRALDKRPSRRPSERVTAQTTS